MSNLDAIRGRQVLGFFTNKSGGAIVAGDVVIMDSANDESFTTTTSASSLSKIGVAQESIANNAQGRVLTAGYASLVNVNASATRAYFLFTHTVAKQATSSATYAQGAFGRVIKAGTSPSALIYDETSQSAAGDLAGKQLDYVEFTSNVNITATTSATSNVIVTGSSVAYDGATIIRVEFQAAYVEVPVSQNLILVLWDDTAGAALGSMAQYTNPDGSNVMRVASAASRQYTPANASRILSIRGFVGSASTAVIGVGAGGAGVKFPGSIRITRVSS